jgi:hypothetical protein
MPVANVMKLFTAVIYEGSFLIGESVSMVNLSN